MGYGIRLDWVRSRWHCGRLDISYFLCYIMIIYGTYGCSNFENCLLYIISWGISHIGGLSPDWRLVEVDALDCLYRGVKSWGRRGGGPGGSYYGIVVSYTYSILYNNWPGVIT